MTKLGIHLLLLFIVLSLFLSQCLSGVGCVLGGGVMMLFRVIPKPLSDQTNGTDVSFCSTLSHILT